MSKWISVEERLPKSGDRVWCSMRNKKRDAFVFSDALIYWVKGRRREWTHSDCNPLDESLKVTHWQPLPEPPKQTEER